MLRGTRDLLVVSSDATNLPYVCNSLILSGRDSNLADDVALEDKGVAVGSFEGAGQLIAIRKHNDIGAGLPALLWAHVLTVDGKSVLE